MKTFRRLTLVTLLAGFTMASFTALFPAPTKAVSGRDFTAGNIIQDRNFYNHQSMNAAEIQAFLNAKVPNCSPGYTCLKNYSQSTPTMSDSQGYCGVHSGGTKVAAQIIYDVGLVCGVNPQVLLTLLQKESSLVTSTAPSSIQYRSATGYACPDSAPCDSQYYGFFNQVYRAAWGYKQYRAYPNSFNYRAFRTNSILYNPNTSCGRSDVFIENQATAGLYIYTPYRPNQAALNNLYGTGDGCSSYGNRNFWRIFSDWFGIDNKPLIRTTSSGDLYYTIGQYKYRVTSMDVAAEYGFSTSEVAFVTQETLNSIPDAPGYASLNYFAKSDSDSDEDGGNIYLISGRNRYLITSMEQFSHFGLSTDRLPLLPYYALVRLPLAGNLSQFVRNGNGFVYNIDSSQKHGIFQLDHYNSLNPSGYNVRLSDFILSTLTTGQPLINGAITLKGGDGRLWEATNSGWNYISSMNIAACLGVDDNISPFTPEQSPLGTRVDDASCVARSQSDSTVYLLDKNKKYPHQSAWGLGIPVTLHDSLLSNKQVVSAPANAILKGPLDSSIYTLQNGNKRHLSDMISVGEVDSSQTIMPMTTNVLSTVPTGKIRYSSGTLLADTSGRLYVINNDQRYYIDSMELFHAYGFDTNRINRLPTDTVNGYTSGGNLEQKVTLNSSSVIFDKAVGWQVAPGISSAYGFSTVPTYQPSMGRYASAKQATRYIKPSDSAQLYYLENGNKRPAYSWSAWQSVGGTNENITVLSPFTVSQFPTGSPI